MSSSLELDQAISRLNKAEALLEATFPTPTSQEVILALIVEARAYCEAVRGLEFRDHYLQKFDTP